MILLDGVQTLDADRYVDELPTFLQTGLQVRDVMSKTQFVVSADKPVLTVAQIMKTHQATVIAIEEAGTVVGVVTEREIARGAARHGSQLRDLKAREIMTPLPPGVGPECPLTEAAQAMHAHRLRWFPVVANHDVVSILTQADLTRAATLLPELGTVADIMSEDIITIDAARSLLEAAQIMIDRDISCVIATHLGKLAGVLTEVDILDQVVTNGTSWSAVSVADVMTFPVVSIESECSLSEARATMDRTHVHRLIVVDEGRPCGLITQTDITRAINRRLREQECQLWRRLAESQDAIFAVDLDENTVYVNAAFTRLLEYADGGAFVGHPFLPPCCWPNPTDRETFMAVFTGNGLQVQETRLRTGSGRDIRVAVFSTIVKSFRGDVIGRQGVVWPVTVPGQ